MLACRLLGHRYAFRADGRTMHWSCERGCGAAGSKRYESPETAARFATAFDHRDSADTGRRAPLLGMFPLRVFHRLRQGGHKKVGE